MNGTIQLWTMESQALRGNPLGDPHRRTMPVYLPPGYANGSGRYPVVYFLHGFAGSPMAWLNPSAFTRNVPTRLDDLIADAKIPPVIGVFVDGWTVLGGSQWINSEAIGNYRDYVARDLVAAIDREFRTHARAESRAVVGHSSGGYGALVMGRHHPDVFGHLGVQSPDSYFEYGYLPDFPKAANGLVKFPDVEAWFCDMVTRASATKLRGDDFPVINIVGMSAAYSPKQGAPLNLELPFELPTARIREDVWNRWLEHDPVRFVRANVDAFRRLTTVFLDCGARDEFNLRWGTRMLAEALRAGSVDVLHEEYEDGHMQVNYRYDRSLSYLVPRLSR